MTAVHQFVSALLPRDATGDHTLALRDAFRAAGWESLIFAEASHDELATEAIHFTDYPRYSAPGDVLLYQFGTGSPITAFLAERPETLVVNYHNITPAHFYDDWEPATAARIGQAVRDVRSLAPRCALAIADSEFNAGELRDADYGRVEVIPVVVAFDVAPDGNPPTAQRTGGRGSRWLSVGRMAPSKCQHRIVEALWLARRWCDPEATLVLVGPESTPSYAAALDAFVDELGLGEAVRRTSGLSPEELSDHYREADVFVSASEHEGFCTPLVEAMVHRVPVVARDAGAVSETLGPAGVLLADSGPGRLAAAVCRMLGDERLRDVLVAEGLARASRFDPRASLERFTTVIGDLAARSAA